jgi:hypothetical protein
MRQELWTSVDPDELDRPRATPEPPPRQLPPPPFWRIGLDPDHVALWTRYGIQWLAFVGFALIAGWHLKPRLDEFLVVVTLPLWLVLAPYVVFCFLAAVVKAWWMSAAPTRWRRSATWQRWLRAIGRDAGPPVVRPLE